MGQSYQSLLKFEERGQLFIFDGCNVRGQFRTSYLITLEYYEYNYKYYICGTGNLERVEHLAVTWLGFGSQANGI